MILDKSEAWTTLNSDISKSVTQPKNTEQTFLWSTAYIDKVTLQEPYLSP